MKKEMYEKENGRGKKTHEKENVWERKRMRKKLV